MALWFPMATVASLFKTANYNEDSLSFIKNQKILNLNRAYLIPLEGKLIIHIQIRYVPKPTLSDLGSTRIICY